MKALNMKHLTLIFIYLLFGLPAFSNSYYISTGGNDSNNGSLSSPWATFSKANTILQAGDILYVRGGSYAEYVVWTANGATGNPITITNYPGETVILDGDFVLPSAVEKPGETTAYGTSLDTNYKGLFTISANNIIFDGFTIRESKGRGLEIQGTPTTYIEEIIARNLIVYDIRHSAVNVSYTRNVQLINMEVYNSGIYAPFRRPTTVLNHPQTVVSKYSENVIFSNIIVHECWGEGLAPSTNTDGFLVENCVSYDHMSTLVYVHRSRNGTIRNSKFYFTESGESFDLNRTIGIYINNEDPKQPYDTIEVKNVDIYNNLIVGCKRNIHFGTGQPASVNLTKNVRVFNNTLLFATSDGSTAIGINIHNTALIENIEIFNNIIYNQPTIKTGAAPNSSTEINAHHNYWGEPPSNILKDAATDLNGNPQLENLNISYSPGTLDETDYNLTNSSPAINAGNNMGLAFDYYNASRTGNPDLGFMEFNGILPVLLLNFSIKQEELANILFWQTTFENNNKGFEVQKSIDGINFERIGFVDAKGNDDDKINYYSFSDDLLLAETTYYRLKQVDFDGAFIYSEILSVFHQQSDALEIYPNPAIDHIILKNSNSLEISTLDIFDVHQNLLCQHFPFGNEKVDISMLPAGLYFIRLTGNNREIKTGKFIKQ